VGPKYYLRSVLVPGRGQIPCKQSKRQEHTDQETQNEIQRVGILSNYSVTNTITDRVYTLYTHTHRTKGSGKQLFAMIR